MTVGRKGLYRDWIQNKEGLAKIVGWIKDGKSYKEITKRIGITETTWYGWLKRYSKFAATVAEARKLANEELERIMDLTATGKMESVEIRSIIDPISGQTVRIEKTVKQIPPNATMQIFLATNRMRDKYKHRQDTTLNIKDIEKINPYANLSEEELRKLASKDGQDS